MGDERNGAMDEESWVKCKGISLGYKDVNELTVLVIQRGDGADS